MKVLNIALNNAIIKSEKFNLKEILNRNPSKFSWYLSEDKVYWFEVLLN